MSVLLLPLRTRRFARLLALPGLLWGIACPPAGGADIVSAWNGTVGNWSDASRWSSAAFPNNGAMTYDAIINGGSVTLDQNIKIESLTLTAGAIDGPSDLELHAASLWSGGNMGGSGATTFKGLLTITGSHNIEGTRTLNIEQGATFNGTANSFINNMAGTTINNRAGSIFQIDGNNDISGIGTFNNFGTFLKSAGAVGDGVTSIAGAFNNAEIVNVTSGELSLRGGGTQSGSFNVGTGGVLGFAVGVFEINLGTTIAGNGTTHFASNNVNFNTVTFDVDTLATQSAGTISGDGTINFHKAFNWSGGSQAGTGISNFHAAVAITGSHNVQGTRTINIAHSATYSSTTSHAITMQAGTTFNNLAGATLGIEGNGDFTGLGVVNNAGTLNKTASAMGDGVSLFAGPFHNSGVVNVDSGELSIRGGGTQGGKFNVATDGVLGLAVGVIDINAGTTIEGEGMTHFASNNVNFNTTSFDIDTRATQSAGTIVGDGILNFNKEFIWSGGSHTGAGVSNFNAAVTITNNHNLQGTRTVNNGGNATFNSTSSHAINMQSGSAFNNLADATFSFEGNADFAGVGVFNNAGTLNKSAGPMGDGVSHFAGPFNNSGVVNVDSGELHLRGGGTQTGEFNVDEEGMLHFAIGAFDIDAGTIIEGEGETHFGSLNVNFNTPTFDIDTRATQTAGAISGNGILNFNKDFTWSGGAQLGAGVSNFNAAVTITNNHTLQDSRTINNAQSATFNSIANHFINNATGTTFNNLANAIFTIEGNSDFTGLGVFNNAGTFNKSGGDSGDGVTGFAGPFTNSGVINVTSGALHLDGVFTNYDAGTDTLTGGTYNVAGTLRFQNADINTNKARIKLDGPGSQIISHTAADALTDLATNDSGAYFGIVGGRNFATKAATFTNRGELELGGGIFSAPAVSNEASGEIFGFGTLAVRPTSSGTIRASGGTLTLPQGIQGGSGTIVVDPGATLDMSAASSGSSADTVQHNGAGLNLGANNLAISVDYNNANFGTGNSFNHRANVIGTGAINASPGVSQTLAGDVTAGNTSAATMAFGNVHVGDSPTRNFRVNNVGASGPSLRGALQTSVVGTGITDSRLTGSGVTPQNFGPIAPGSSTSDYAVTFDATTAGPLVTQVLKITNNFDNVADQTLTITGAAYRYASPSAHTPEPVDFGIIHVGDIASQALTIGNSALNDGFSERLSASIGSPTGHATTNGGSFANLNPGATNATSLSVGIDTSSAGMKSGTATISLTSVGAGTSGLPNTNLPSQVVNISAQVNNYADPLVVKVAGAGTLTSNSATSYTLDLGTYVQGQQVMAELGVKNDVAAPADTLAGMFGTAMAGAFDLSGFGSFSALAAGATRNDLVIELDTSMVGTFMGSITLHPQSTNPRPFSLDLDPITIHLVAEVTLAGDFNDDGVVDARDYVVWRNNLGNNVALPNDPTPGSVTAADYTVWKGNFGATDAGSLFVSHAVPEPATLWLVGLGLAGLALGRRRASGV